MPTDGAGASAGATLRPATAADLQAVLALLEAAELPGAGVAEHLAGFVLAEDQGRVVGAEDYFPRYGFQRIDRADASTAVKQSVEFREACPASAVAMALDLDTDLNPAPDLEAGR